MSSRRIEDLSPLFQQQVRTLLERGQAALAPTGWTVFITDGYRSLEEQAQLYAQGRTAVGKVVTMAQPGQSAHNYGLAVDLAFQKDGQLSYDPNLYKNIDPIARELGFVLGVDWQQFPDRPHFELLNWTAYKATAFSKLAVEAGSGPTGTSAVIPAHRNVTVGAPNGVKVRTAPNTSASVITIFTAGETFTVVGFVQSESVAENDLWWVTADNYYVWSGATSFVPALPTVPTQQQPAEQLVTTEPIPTAPAAPLDPIDAEFVTSLKQQITILQAQVQQLELEKVQINQTVPDIQTLKNANVVLTDQIEAYKQKNSEVKKQLSNSIVTAFSGWQLRELPTGAARLWAAVAVGIQVIGLALATRTQPLIIGWLPNARLRSVKVSD